MIAYDVPYHGKSVPPTGKAWWQEEYTLTEDFLMQVQVTLSRELELERPVYGELQVNMPEAVASS